MKKIGRERGAGRLLLVVFLLMLTALPAASEGVPAADPLFSVSSDTYDPALAQQALAIAETCYTLPLQQLYMGKLGYLKTGDYNMARQAGDTRHVAAYCVYQKAPGAGRDALVIAVRGTGEGEWPLNMELMPGGRYDLEYAENFFLAAQEVLDTLAEQIDGLQNPLFLITGHSRGAAVANILGAKLTDRFGAENVYAYTFATPRTVRGDYPAYGNIFNVINPADLITYLPFPQWGFGRYGVDVTLPVDGASPQLIAQVKEAYDQRADKIGEFAAFPDGSRFTVSFVETMAKAFPTVAESYTVRHALAHPGEAGPEEEGMTGSELLLLLATSTLGGGGEAQSADLQKLGQGRNDFSAILLHVLSLISGPDAAALGISHMPASYGAWMAVTQ